MENIETYYDRYWQHKDDSIDGKRVKFVVAQIQQGEKVLDIGCGPGQMLEKLTQKNTEAIGIDVSSIALKRAARKGLDVMKLDVETEALPFDDETFDVIIFTQTIEHLFDYDKVMRESHRVLKPNGRIILSIPNIAHFRFRLWMLMGRFPYIEDTQTHSQHIRFFTVKDGREMCQKYDFKVERTVGNAGLWSPIYHWRMYTPGIKQFYEWLAKLYPAMFAFHVTFLCRKHRTGWMLEEE